MNSTHGFPHSQNSLQRGMALVVTLALVVLLTIVVMAFFSHATADRNVETSRAHRTEADVLARSALDYTVGSILDEITDPSHSTSSVVSGNPVYLPINTADKIPRRMLAASLPLTESRFFNLVRQSVATADPNASTHSTASAARNGRTITTGRWNSPNLLIGDGFNAEGQLPNWIYVTTDGVSATPSQQVIGRFAYNAYDISGLLNVNAAGFPGTLNAAQISQLKGTPSGASLLQLSSEITQTDIDNLMSFRSAAAAANGGIWPDNVKAFAREGFLSTVATSPETATSYTNNYFVGRQDLLRYARTQNPAFSQALPYLTHFSRSLNAPSHTFAAPTADNPNFSDVRFSSDIQVSHYGDQGNLAPYQVRAGDPLLQRRFSLAKIAWLTPTGPASGISPAAIQATFGLQWNASEERWDYVSSGTATQSEIATLAQVSGQNRAPNFFELLKAGILADTVGIAASTRTMAMTGGQTVDANNDLQILRIGANIIDCADTDNYPTRIAMNFGGMAIEVAGVEDLPYIHSLWMSGLQRWDTSTEGATKLTDADIFWVPLMINPHRPSPNTPVSSPDHVAVSILEGILTGLDDNNDSPQGLSKKGMTKSLVSTSNILIPRQADGLTGAQLGYEDFRAGPLPMRNSAANNRLVALIPYAAGANTDVQGFHIFSYGAEYTPMPAPAPPRNKSEGHQRDSQHRIYVNNLMLRLQYLTPGGVLKTYATLSGNDALPTTTGLSGAGGNSAVTTPPGFASWTDKVTLTGSGSRAVLWDPRTSRLGPGFSGFQAAIASLPPLSGTADRLVGAAPIAWGGDKTAQPIFTGLWPQGGKSRDASGNYTNIADKDGIFRPADGYLNNAANPYRQTVGAALNPTHVSRPVILQRPYESVAELGYVFRDTPWKTLSFFDETSGDSSLLDLFSVVDQPTVTAGTVNLNTPHENVRQALLQQTAQNPDGSTPLSNVPNIATAYGNYAFTAGAPNQHMPGNVADLVRFMSSTELTGAFATALNPVKYRREAIVRSLADATQTRTWNLLIDVIAQSGRFPTDNTDTADFSVQGEQRYWLSIAIDRYTGKVIDRQIEAVNE